MKYITTYPSLYHLFSISTLCSTWNTHEQIHLYIYLSIYIFTYSDTFFFSSDDSTSPLQIKLQTNAPCKNFSILQFAKKLQFPNGIEATFLHQSQRCNKTEGAVEDVSRRGYISPSHLHKNTLKPSSLQKYVTLEQQPLWYQHKLQTLTENIKITFC